MATIPTHYNSDVQIGAMKCLYPQFTAVKRGPNDILFTGEIVVKPPLPVYTVSIRYRGQLRPQVKVLKPTLVTVPPHFYRQDDTLCLYHPKNYRWTKEKLVAKEVIQWTAAWLYFYEVWLQTGIWYGPEAEHDELILKTETN